MPTFAQYVPLTHSTLPATKTEKRRKSGEDHSTHLSLVNRNCSLFKFPSRSSSFFFFFFFFFYPSQMDYIQEDNHLWEWKGGQDYHLPNSKSSNLGNLPDSLWEGDHYVFDETTPVKAIGDLAHNLSITTKYKNEEARYSSKRRRVLQFNNHSINNSLFCNENTQYVFQSSKENEDLMEDVAPEDVNWESGFCGGRFPSVNSGLDESSEAWLSSCFSDGTMSLNSDNRHVFGSSDDQVDISEFCSITDETESDTVQRCPTPSPTIVYKGRKSQICSRPNLASSVAYPFALVKPCGIHGDVTLNDINQRICSPVSSTSKGSKDEDPLASYPTSTFSGKPVVVKTKIRTEGGKGSITIMRTKG